MMLGSRSVEDNSRSPPISPPGSSGRFHDLTFTVLRICALESTGRILSYLGRISRHLSSRW